MIVAIKNDESRKKDITDSSSDSDEEWETALQVVNNKVDMCMFLNFKLPFGEIAC